MFLRISPWYEIYQQQLENYVTNSTDFFERMIALIPLEFKGKIEKAGTELTEFEEQLNLDKRELERKGNYEKEQIEDILNDEYNHSSIPYNYERLQEEQDFFFSNVSKSQILLDYAFLDSFLQKICETASEKAGTKFVLKYFRGSENSDIKRYFEYLEIVIGLDISAIKSNEAWFKLMELIKIRNAIAHNNDYSDDDGKVNEKLKKAIDIYKEYIEADTIGSSFNIKHGLRTEFSKLLKQILTATITLLGIKFKEDKMIDMKPIL